MGQPPNSRASIQTGSEEEDLVVSEEQADLAEVLSEADLEASKISAKCSELEHEEGVEAKVTSSRSYLEPSIVVADPVPQQTFEVPTSKPQSTSPS
jgi:hypothetical protein